MVWWVLWAAMQAGVFVFCDVLGIAQFVPVFARRYFSHDDPGRGV